jgi:SWI/SNF-related matrix-associated actin-dependent regulator of chromatin subfamily D
MDYVPESQLYTQLSEFEQRLDATITRKTLDIQDQLSKPIKKIPRILRVFISNSYSVDTETWTATIQGRLLDVCLPYQEFQETRQVFDISKVSIGRNF